MRHSDGFPVRLEFTKRGKVRFISHRDVARAFERAFRIEELPLAFTEGFSPRPKVSFGLALSVGHESDAEYLDVELREPVDTWALVTRLSPALPEGIDVIGAARLADRAPALQESVTLVEYDVTVRALVGDDGAPADVDPPVLDAAARTTLSAAELPVTRSRKGRETTDDIRPAIRLLAVGGPPTEPVLTMELTTQPRGARPREVLEAIGTATGLDLAEHRVTRTSQWIERDGARLWPLAADAFALADEACAS